MDAYEFLLHNKESGVDRLLLCDMGNATMYGVIHVTMSGCNLMRRLCIHPRKRLAKRHLSRNEKKSGEIAEKGQFYIAAEEASRP